MYPVPAICLSKTVTSIVLQGNETEYPLRAKQTEGETHLVTKRQGESYTTCTLLIHYLLLVEKDMFRRNGTQTRNGTKRRVDDRGHT